MDEVGTHGTDRQTDRQTDGRGATLNVVHREDSIITCRRNQAADAVAGNFASLCI